MPDENPTLKAAPLPGQTTGNEMLYGEEFGSTTLHLARHINEPGLQGELKPPPPSSIYLQTPPPPLSFFPHRYEKRRIVHFPHTFHLP